jgi:hypothetical protein
MNSELVKKLRLTSGMRVLILQAPTGYLAELDGLPETQLQTEPDGTYDYVQLFCHSVAEVEQHAATALAAARPDSLVWLCYPKKSSKLYVDLNRDQGWDAVKNAGWEGVALVSVDNDWSAMRFRPVGQAQPRKRPMAATIEGVDEQARTVTPPDDLVAALQTHGTAWDVFDNLAYSHKKEYVEWITGAKKLETRQSRIEKAVEKLAVGIKRPSLKS